MTRLIVGLGAAAVFLSLSMRARGDDVPRYALEPGRVLDYELRASSRSSSQPAKDEWESIVKSRVWVVDRDEDGAARVVVRQVVSATRKDAADDSGFESTSLSRFDIRPNGEIPPSPSLDPDTDATMLFPRLPDDAKQAAGAGGWQSRDDRDDSTITYAAVANDEGKGDGKAMFNFEADVSGATELIYEGSDHRVFHFDRARGVIAGAETTRSFGAHMNSESNETLELKSVTVMTPAELTTFREEMNRYFDARQAYREAGGKAMKAGDEAETILNDCRAILADARAKTTLPEPTAALDEMLKNHDEAVEYRVEGAKRYAENIGKPAPGWGPVEASAPRAAADSEIKDLDGRTQSLARYRGKVLVLDFWYRGCGWCMRAMPQVKMLADRYRDQPVAFFAMNNDRDEKDARFVVQAMKLDYPVIRSMDLPSRYNVEGFPTLVIIDQEGNIADIHVGYTPQLFERISETIDRLLKPAE